MRSILRRLRYFLRQQQLDADLAEELDFHRTMKERDLQSRGVHLAQAHFMVRRALGSETLARDQSRDVWIWPWLDGLMRDVRLGARLLLKNPGFSAMAIATLTIAIGA